MVRLLLSIALLGTVIGNPMPMVWAAGGMPETCGSREDAPEDCCGMAVEVVASCCTEAQIPDGAPKISPSCACGHDGEKAAVLGNGPSISVRTIESDPSDGPSLRACPRPESVHGLGRPTPEPHPPRV